MIETKVDLKGGKKTCVSSHVIHWVMKYSNPFESLVIFRSEGKREKQQKKCKSIKDICWCCFSLFLSKSSRMEFPLAIVYRKLNELEIRLMIMAIPSQRNTSFVLLPQLLAFHPKIYTPIRFLYLRLSPCDQCLYSPGQSLDHRVLRERWVERAVNELQVYLINWKEKKKKRNK